MSTFDKSNLVRVVVALISSSSRGSKLVAVSRSEGDRLPLGLFGGVHLVSCRAATLRSATGRRRALVLLCSPPETELL